MDRRSVALAVAGVALLAGSLAGCSGEDGDGSAPATAPTTVATAPAALVPVQVRGAALGRPPAWRPAPRGSGAAATFVSTGRQGEVRAQLDVVVDRNPAGSAAEALSAVVQGARRGRVGDLREVRRAAARVPGAASAFLTEVTYLAPGTDTLVRSLDLLAVDAAGRTVLVRVSGPEARWDAQVAGQIVSSVRMGGSDGAGEPRA